MKEWFKENKWIFVGGIVIVAAILTPLILFIGRNHLDQKTFEALGPVGDFFGGTTVGLLTLASMLFVIASISMQRKQLDMQQDELKMQREELAKTREEFELTNKTLTKQQFESTFFNMISLHHNLLEDLEGGRYYFNKFYNSLSKNYKHSIKLYWANQLLNLKNRHFDKFKKLLLTIYLNDQKIDNLSNHLHNINSSDFNKINLIKEIEIKSNQYFSRIKSDLIDDFERKEIDGHLERCIDNTFILGYLQTKDSYRLNYKTRHLHDYYNITNVEFFENIEDEWVVNFMKQSRKETLLNPLTFMKKTTYEKVYTQKEEQIGHYYRNLYRIVRFIEDEHFSNNSKENEKEKKKYRGILRAQLSSMELLMLFYNVVYSEKGEKFKEILKGNNFFDDHLIESKFLWANDKDELAALK
ncbi:putative phage abortive infection protein [Bacillus altitudinis]|uniref:putative phage abortive infection protein n=1 Tax=Bacillus altitudinis TaxID=293387 RepID=UPI003CF4EB07